MFILGCGHQQQIKTISKSQSPKVSSYINGDQQVQTILTLKMGKKASRTSQSVNLKTLIKHLRFTCTH